jgi:hypothetical protein
VRRSTDVKDGDVEALVPAGGGDWGQEGSRLLRGGSENLWPLIASGDGFQGLSLGVQILSQAAGDIPHTGRVGVTA